MDDMRRCILCANFSFLEGDPGYSEYTPGSDPYFTCGAGVTFDEQISSHVNLADVSEKGFYAALRTAEHCEKYERQEGR
jgi:hypothetical protein